MNDDLSKEISQIYHAEDMSPGDRIAGHEAQKKLAIEAILRCGSFYLSTLEYRETDTKQEIIASLTCDAEESAHFFSLLGASILRVTRDTLEDAMKRAG